jgi:hypothetical protein
MYCPKCGHQQVPEELRFCSRCGFKLDTVKTCLAEAEETAGWPDAGLMSTCPQPREVNMGVVLMFVATVLTGVIAIGWHVLLGYPFNPINALLMLVASFTSILLFSRPLRQIIYKLLSLDNSPADHVSARRKELGFGALLMFIGSLLSASVLTAGELKNSWWIFLLVLVMVFVLLLFSSERLMQAVRSLVTEDETNSPTFPRVHTARHPITEGGRSGDTALPPAQGIPISVFESQRVATAEIVSPPSVTERTTNLLGNK